MRIILYIFSSAFNIVVIYRIISMGTDHVLEMMSGINRDIILE